MLKSNQKFVLVFLFLLIGMMAQSQPFINEINNFKKQDSLTTPPSNPILFIGSSSFTNWKDVQDYFPNHTILNRGFGGSSLPHLIYYINDIAFKYSPSQVVIYCGENDLTGGPNINADSIFNRFNRLHQLLRSKWETIPILYISMKPSPNKRKYLSTMKAANELIKNHIEELANTKYVDVFSHMINSDDEIRSDIFLSDSLHMNKKGYQIWQPLIEPYLIKTNSHFFTPSNKKIKITGRVDYSNPDKPKIWAAGVYMTIKFKGPSFILDITDEQRWGKNQNYITYIIDNNPPVRIKTRGKKNRLELATNLSNENHTIVICKETEAEIGYIQINGVLCDKLLTPASPLKRKIEFIGNSITCGMGADEKVVPCNTGEWYDQHSAYNAYGPLVARSLNAQWQLTSQSGIGLQHSCCNKKTIMPQVFDKINVSTDSITWDFSKYTPNLVTVCLGQNDGIQDMAEFTANYIKFIQQVRSAYPKATVLLLNSPMANDELKQFIAKAISSVKDQLNKLGDDKVYTFSFSKQYISGCGSHPNLADHQEIAKELSVVVKKIMRW